MRNMSWIILAILTISGCATVRQEDLDAWQGQPISKLEAHPIFLTVPVVKTKTSDGTEIWNYVNGSNIGNCTQGGSIYSGTINYAAYTQFSTCVQNFAACNNIFYIKNGIVQKYTPIGTGGARCYTTKQLQPDFSGAFDIR